MASVGLVSLGCDKNRVDAECMLGLMAAAGYTIVNNPALADVILVNTCGFLKTAVHESVEAVVEMAQYRQNGQCSCLLVTGCMAQRYGGELAEELPEADGFLGVAQYPRVVEAVEAVKRGELVCWFDEAEDFGVLPRCLTTQPWSAYLKIAEGCDNHCTYCAIPSIRGAYRCRPVSDILQEAQKLIDGGVRELILVAQDTTRYHDDGVDLSELMTRLAALPGLEWLRVLYCYPERITDELLQVMANNPKICKYIDMPIQHASDPVLKHMGRPSKQAALRDLYRRIRVYPDFVLRTTLMTGFPGEGPADMENLKHFLRDCPFDRVGVFAFSAEEGTAAQKLGRQIPPKVRESRRAEIMALAAEISFEQNQRWIGRKRRVLLESRDDQGWIGRSEGEIPLADGCVHVSGAGNLQNHTLGQWVDVEIQRADAYDLWGVII